MVISTVYIASNPSRALLNQRNTKIVHQIPNENNDDTTDDDDFPDDNDTADDNDTDDDDNF